MRTRGDGRLIAAACIVTAVAAVAVYFTIEDRGPGHGNYSGTSVIISPHLIAGMPVRPAVASIAFSPNGKKLAIGLENGLVQLRNSRTGKTLASFNPKVNNSTEFAFSPDGKTLAVGIETRQHCVIELVSTQTMKSLRTLTLNVSEIDSLAFSPDGKTIAVAADTILGLLNLSTDSSIYVPDRAPGDGNDPEGEATYVSFSANGDWLAVAGSSDEVKLWNVHTEKFVKDAFFLPKDRGIPASAEPAASISTASISPDGGLVAVGGWILGLRYVSGYQGAAMWLWNTKTGAVTSLIRGTITQSDNTGVADVAFNHQGTLLATGDDTGTIQIRNATNGKVISTSYAPITGYTHVSFSPDGKTLASGEWVQTSDEDGLSGGLQLWNVYTPAKPNIPPTVTLSDLLSAPVPAACTHAAGTLAYGVQRALTQDQGFMQLAWLDGGKSAKAELTAFGKLTASNADDAATVLVCNAGGVPWPQIIAFYGPGPKLLGWAYLTSFRLPGKQPGDNTQVNKIAYYNGGVTAEWSTQDSGDPDAISTLDYSADLRLVNGKIVATHLTATTELQTAEKFFSDLRVGKKATAAKLAANGVAAEAMAAFRNTPSALAASLTCYGLNSINMPAPVTALTAAGGTSQVSPAPDRVCVLPSSNPGAEWIVLGMRHSGFRKWQVLWLRTV
jgi:WD40 repeat protein